MSEEGFVKSSFQQIIGGKIVPNRWSLLIFFNLNDSGYFRAEEEAQK